MSPVPLALENFTADKPRQSGLHLSSYDVPRSACAVFDPSTGNLSIVFRYIDEEPSTERQLASDIAVRFGKHSGKVLRIVLNVPTSSASDFRARVTDALRRAQRELSNQMSRTHRYNQQQNYAGIGYVLDSNTSTVLSSTSNAVAATR